MSNTTDIMNQLGPEDKWVMQHATVIASVTYKKLPNSVKAGYQWEDLLFDLMAKYYEIRGTLNYSDNWQGYVGRTFNTFAVSLVQTEYDKLDYQRRISATDLGFETAKQFEDGKMVEVRITQDAETSQERMEEDHAIEEKLNFLRDWIHKLCKLTSVEYDEDDILKTAVKLVDSGTILEKGENDSLRNELDELRENLVSNGIGVSLSKGTPKMNNVMKTVRQLFDDGITTRDEIIDYFYDNGLYCNLKSIGVISHCVRVERGLPPEPRKKTHRMKAIQRIDELYQSGVTEINDIKKILNREAISVVSSVVWAEVKKCRKQALVENPPFGPDYMHGDIISKCP